MQQIVTAGLSLLIDHLLDTVEQVDISVDSLIQFIQEAIEATVSIARFH